MLHLEFERHRRRWSQGFLATLTGIRQPEISLIERGRLQPTDEQLERLARALNVAPPSALLKPVVLAEEVAR